MPTTDWLQTEFSYGYDSGDVLSLVPNWQRWKEEKRIGGSYRQVFKKAILPYINSESKVAELGPGKGSWTRAILKNIPEGCLHTIDYQDVEKWLSPKKYEGRLICHKADSNHFDFLEDNYFDFFWSMGVLCHNNIESIEDILKNFLPKMKVGGIAVHQYSNWDKLEKFGWKKGGVPYEFKKLSDNEIWWSRNNEKKMRKVAESLGWKVLSTDLGLVKRDSIIALQKK